MLTVTAEMLIAEVAALIREVWRINTGTSG